MTIRFNCKVGYLEHSPGTQGDQLRIRLEPTAICNGVSPTAADSQIRMRPANADAAGLVDIEYDGKGPGGPVLTLNFNEAVAFDVVEPFGVDFELDVRVRTDAVGPAPEAVADKVVMHREVARNTPTQGPFVINLLSLRRIPTVADGAGLVVPDGKRLYFSETDIDGVTWYRLRLGDFPTAQAAADALDDLRVTFPEAWVAEPDISARQVVLAGAATVAGSDSPAAQPASLGTGNDVDSLMADARAAMVAGDSSRAIQIYTKVLQLPPSPRHPEAQEYLALAREKQGQFAHAKAEYQRYLSLYPNAEGAGRVGQRLAALLASSRKGEAPPTATGAADGPGGFLSDWRIQTFFSQYYRRDVNQPNDQDDIISQSALYSDINVDARRRGERYDVSARLSAGYRSDFLGEDEGSGNDARVSYAYVDIGDAVTGFRGRFGRQSRNTGGVLGRFDGLNLGYQPTELVLVSGVVGKPAYSAGEGIDSERTFYGVSLNYGPVLDGLALGTYVIQQDVSGYNDRQAVGAEFRYFGENQSLWGLVDYDTGYSEIGNAYLQASWRLGSRLSLHAAADRRHNPFLSTSNALIGQPVGSVEELIDIFGESEVRQLALDRSPLSTTYSLGVAHSLTPNLQINVDANRTTVDATPDSGGITGMPESNYSYVSASLVASSLVLEGDVLILGARYSDSDTAQVLSFSIDGRVPVGRSLRINPRLRVDRRERFGEPDYEWIYTPGIRVQYRWGQRVRIELEAGKQFAQRETELVNLDRESYFINLGYQAFF